MKHAEWSALLVLAATLPQGALATPDVVMISGTGYQPASLERGATLRAGTVVRTDASTIVVLVDSWSGGRDAFCQEFVILRGRSYTVPSSTPNDCRETGSGNELAAAMQGRSMDARVRALQFSDAASDMPDPDNIERLRRDLLRLDEQVAAERQEARDLEQQQREAAQRERESARRDAARRDRVSASTDAERACHDVMRRMLAGDAGRSPWRDPDRVSALCAGTRAGEQPGLCIETVMRGRVLTPETRRRMGDEALALCSGSSDASRTVGCYQALRRGDVSHELAVEACSGGGGRSR